MTGKIDIEPIDEDELQLFWLDKINAVSGELTRMLYACEKKGITQSVIGKRLRKDKGWISRIFGAPLNMTIKSLSEVALAMDCDVEFTLVPWEQKVETNAPKTYQNPVFRENGKIWSDRTEKSHSVHQRELVVYPA